MYVSSILFVCHGNICRSPMAEFIMKKLVADRNMDESFHIESAAVSTEEIGNGIYPPARRCLHAHGIPFDSRKTARQVRDDDFDRFDLIVYMDRSNLRWLEVIFSSRIDKSTLNGTRAMAAKIRSMMSFAGISRDVADPWYTDDFETTYQDILTACSALLDSLLADRTDQRL